MMEQKILEAAYGGLLHDIGKPLQRAKARSDLSEEELYITPTASRGGYHTHLHAGYTSRFLQQHLGMYDAFESMVSGHHISDSRNLARQIVRADCLASAIDRADEQADFESNNRKGVFRQVRMSSIFEEVFASGKPILQNRAFLPLEMMSKASYPIPAAQFVRPDLSRAVQEYDELTQKLLMEVDQDPYLRKRIDRRAFSRMYSLFYEYLSAVPASTYEGNQTFVSLFDHLKLTSAIASCLAITNGKEQFHMLEFDVSGIQKFIFRVTEGPETKKYVAKSLRGRSMLVSLITDCITMSYLHEFGLTESNIIFNTGGGALLLLPDTPDFAGRIQKVSETLVKALYERFHTDLTFVQASVECNATELESFKTQKAIELKSRLEEAKSHKYLPVLDRSFFFAEPKGKTACDLCGQEIASGTRCPTCQTIVALSDFLTRQDQLVLLFEFDARTVFKPEYGVQFLLGNCLATLTTRTIIESLEKKKQIDLNHITAVESINHSWLGLTRFLAVDVPIKQDGILPMKEICELASKEDWGDPKLGILKMDVDNLGAIFAYGMAKNRSLSKFLTLSRMMERFFGRHLPEICRDISEIINPEIEEKTENGTLFYINYAGGDDLVILGPAAGILELAGAINQNLNAYTQNPNITISGGIFIQKPQQPIRFGVLEAEKYLSRSKELPEKNGITLLETSIPFAEYDQVLENVGYWRTCLEEQVFSRTSFYSLMKLLDVPTLNEFARRVPLALYSLSRNSHDETFTQTMKKRICAIRPARGTNHLETETPAWKQLERLVLEMKLTIMQTRKNG